MKLEATTNNIESNIADGNKNFFIADVRDKVFI